MNAVKELRKQLSFSQLRFHCSKQQGRTFHVTTVANSSGEAVVQYFSGQTAIFPNHVDHLCEWMTKISYLPHSATDGGLKMELFMLVNGDLLRTMYCMIMHVL